MPLLPRSTYYDKHYRQTAALIRARQPYLVKNIFTGLSIFAFTIAVCKSAPFHLLVFCFDESLVIGPLPFRVISYTICYDSSHKTSPTLSPSASSKLLQTCHHHPRHPLLCLPYLLLRPSSSFRTHVTNIKQSYRFIYNPRCRTRRFLRRPHSRRPGSDPTHAQRGRRKDHYERRIE